MVCLLCVLQDQLLLPGLMAGLGSRDAPCRAHTAALVASMCMLSSFQSLLTSAKEGQDVMRLLVELCGPETPKAQSKHFGPLHYSGLTGHVAAFTTGGVMIMLLLSQMHALLHCLPVQHAVGCLPCSHAAMPGTCPSIASQAFAATKQCQMMFLQEESRCVLQYDHKLGLGYSLIQTLCPAIPECSAPRSIADLVSHCSYLHIPAAWASLLSALIACGCSVGCYATLVKQRPPSLTTQHAVEACSYSLLLQAATCHKHRAAIRAATRCHPRWRPQPEPWPA
jgi:hypothetical protein